MSDTESSQPLDELGPVAVTPEEIAERHESNRRAWNEGAARYRERVPETIEFIRARHSNLHPIESSNLGTLGQWCEVAIHLQCAGGRDTLSLWVEGAKRVIGVDISEVMIDSARRTAEALAAPATFHCCDVLDTPHELDGTADLVYTGRGALNWIHDLARWGGVVARLLRPGGVVSVFDEHPVAWFFDQDATDLRLYPGINYFGTDWASQGWPSTYIGDLDVLAVVQTVKHDRLWTLADVFGALSGAGLVVEKFGEYPDTYWDSFPNLDEDSRRMIPHTFAMLARKPE
jgi:SAM-dependent methyltransferase